MWVPDNVRRLNRSDVAIISHDYEELLFHDFPVLFTGKNELNERLVCSFVERSGALESYLHSVIDEKAYSSFVNQRINYSEVLQNAKYLFAVHWSDQAGPNVYWLNYQDIPDNYRPSDLAIYPELPREQRSFEVEARFVGGLADKHQAVPETASRFQNKFASVLRNVFELRGFKDLIASVRLQAFDESQLQATGSLRIRYNIEISEKNPTMIHDEKLFTPFVDKYITYCLQNLPQDATMLLENPEAEAAFFDELMGEYEKVAINLSGDSKSKREALVKNMLHAAKHLDDITLLVGGDFHQLLLSSVGTEVDLPLGVIDADFGAAIDKTLVQVEELSGKTFVKDEEFQDHSIHIYDLNTDTRKGRGLMRVPGDESKLMKPKITILGNETLTETKYTESLHMDSFVTVKAMATRSGEIIRELEIEFEDA
jgi:hypothetical protein